MVQRYWRELADGMATGRCRMNRTMYFVDVGLILKCQAGPHRDKFFKHLSTDAEISRDIAHGELFISGREITE